MGKIEDILSNIKSIGYFLASKKDTDINNEFVNTKKEFVSDIVDIKLSDLQYNLDLLQKYFTQMERILRIKICIASSGLLSDERNSIENYLSWKNDKLIDSGVYLQYNVWEKKSKRFNHTYKQEDYNKELVYDSEIFICLIGDRVGKFTKEEFDEARKKFEAHEKPYVFYVFFKKYTGAELERVSDSDGWSDRLALRKHISELKQVYGEYDNKDSLIQQIDEFIEADIEIVKSKIK